ncbi:MAG TPA: glycosyltransferase family 2 protein [Candidatus Wallbacteria bacterium]|nr:glycosyltransferase family 2 protein [Candidatus Wallbacteria bacterium]
MNIDNTGWQIPCYEAFSLKPKKRRYAVCVPVINEGERIRKELLRMKAAEITAAADVIICDGGSSDGSLSSDLLNQTGVRALLVKKGAGKLSAQLRMGYSYALLQGYDGVVTVDGNDKDNVDAIPDFLKDLDEGYDLVQGSRYIKGGRAINTPMIRALAVKLIHIPVISWLSGFNYTDTTNGYRAYSKKFLADPRVRPFREIFNTYELLAYLSVAAPKLGFRVKETPVTREYPKCGAVPTKISAIGGNFKLLKILLDLYLEKYDPPRS